MTELRVADFYERTLYEGEPIRQMAAPTRLDRAIEAPRFRVGQNLYWLGDWFVRLPPLVVRPAPDIQRMAQEIGNWTGWSARRLGAVLGTSHTTVRAVQNGRPVTAGHSGDLRQRIVDAHAVVSRIFVLADRDPGRTANALDTAPGGGRSARTLMEHEDPAKAYVAALDILRPPAEGLLVGSRPAEPGRATAPLHD